MLGAMARLAAERPAGRPTVVMACTVNEEYGFSGATGLCERWSDGRSSLLPRPPEDAAIVAEPTKMLGVVVAHKKSPRWRLAIRMAARAHSSRPAAGDNAIYLHGPSGDLPWSDSINATALGRRGPRIRSAAGRRSASARSPAD